MAFHDDLLAQALQLVHSTPPTQASLRRAVSSAYYAVFHLLIDAAVANWSNPAARASLARAFDHGTMKSASMRVSNSNLFPFADEDPSVVSDLRLIADTFVQLQNHRHFADYNLTKDLEVTHAVNYVRSAGQVFATWPKLQASQIAQDYLVSLMVKAR